MSPAFSDPKQYDIMQRAFYAFFDSELLTRADYLHILRVLTEKLPIYQSTGNLESFMRLAIDYAKFNYPPNPDIERVITAFIGAVAELPATLVSSALTLILRKTEKSDEFVGVEARELFFLYDTSESELNLIKKFANH